MTNSTEVFDRRSSTRLFSDTPVQISFSSNKGEEAKILGIMENASPIGLRCRLTSSIPKSTLSVLLQINGKMNINERCSVVWRDDVIGSYGLQFSKANPEWWTKILNLKSQFGWNDTPSRRKDNRRSIEKESGLNQRKNIRRYVDLISILSGLENDTVKASHKRVLFRNKTIAFDPAVLEERRAWLEDTTGAEIEHIKHFSEPVENMSGKIENPIGVAQVPLGIAGPVLINGSSAKGTFYVPLATNEGALISSYTMGMLLMTRSGGARTEIVYDRLRVSPVFVFETLMKARIFVKWIESNFKSIKSIAESTTKHGKLESIEPLVYGNRVILKFWYTTGDAMGMNMICKATSEACKMIVPATKPLRFYLRSNYSSNKKLSYSNLISGYGKGVTAECIIPKEILGVLKVTSQDVVTYYQDTLQSSLHAGMIGANGHIANGLTALYIACGQDVATVANSSSGITNFEVTKSGDLYVSIYLPSILVGTVGGGTHYGTAKECLNILGCLGTGKAKKFAEVVAAVALAGEIAITVSIVNGTYVDAHEIFGRNRP